MQWICICLVMVLLSGCEKMAIFFTPPKKPQIATDQLSQQAEEQFWQTLHQGKYDQLPRTTTLLTLGYLAHTSDPRLAAHLGFAHIWKITERQRLKNIPPTITNEIILAKQYFKDATVLNPQDARLQGFLGVSMLANGQIFGNEREQVRGYFQLKRAIAMWPQFNLFTAGYPMSTLDSQTKQFKEALAWQWQTLDLCAHNKINKNNPDFSSYLRLETHTGPARACWNSWIAPHNFEGFFLNMGDMLVKQGDWQTAIKIYRNAQLSKTYQQWPYRSMLERRIINAKHNVAYFQKNNGLTADHKIMFNSGFGCAVCHQKT